MLTTMLVQSHGGDASGRASGLLVFWSDALVEMRGDLQGEFAGRGEDECFDGSASFRDRPGEKVLQ